METFDPQYRRSNFPSIRPQWLALRQEDVLLPALEIVDSHHHFWDEEASPYHAQDLLADIDAGQGHRVVSTVFVEAKARFRSTGPDHLRPVGETQFAAEQAQQAPAGGPRICEAIVGWADLSDPQVEETLDAHMQAGQGRFRGIRCRAAWSDDPVLAGPADGPPPKLLCDPTFQKGVHLLTRLGLSLDVWIYHTQLDDVLRLAEACPETTIILNHVGGPLGIGPYAGRRDEVFAAWSDSVRQLGKRDNVVIKLGGLAMPRTGFPFASSDIPESSATLAAAWKPYIETCIEAFGPTRAMFESNFPVDKGMCSYGVLWNAFKRVGQSYTAAEQAALFHGTAKRTYRLN